MMSSSILVVRNLSRTFKRFTAVDNVSFEQRGSIHALIGPNGAGITTCFNLLTKFLDPGAGSIAFDDVDITQVAPARVARRDLIRSLQISAVFPHLTVLKNVRVALQRRLATAFHFWRSDRSLKMLDTPYAWVVLRP